MKKTIKALKLPSIFLLIIISFIACDKDFSNIDSAVLGKDNTNFTIKDTTLSITAYNKKLNSLQINGLASNLFGVFNDPVYGQTKASIVTQVSTSNASPDFGDNTVIDSVILKIPYYTTLTGETDDEGNAKYSIDSLYGDGSIKLSVYRNNYFLRDFNPSGNLSDAQNYFSRSDVAANGTDNYAITETAVINFDNFKSDLIEENLTFKPKEGNFYLETYSDEDTDNDGQPDVDTRISEAPSFRIKFTNTDFWKALIIEKEDDIVLSNNSYFQNYFRGLYFKAENTTEDGTMFMLNTRSADASIIIYYTYETTTTDAAGASTTTASQSTYNMSFSGNILNTFNNNYNLVTLEDGDKTLGDETLYLKGAEGSMAVVDLFPGFVECENEDGTTSTISALDCFLKTYRETDADDNYIKVNGTGDFILKQLINEAQLIVYEHDIMQTYPKDANANDYSTFDRIYAYDIKNNQPTIDYFIDPTENTQQAFSSKVISLGQRIKDDKNVAKYKIRLTEHLNNILLKDSTNTKIGLVLSTNVNYTNNAEILESNDAVTSIPAAALLTPRGTILHGSNVTAVNESKKMKLQVFFTKPNN
ncbi:MAG: DUF4270 domain-containing protein [Flavobacteriaceae bacterium]